MRKQNYEKEYVSPNRMWDKMQPPSNGIYRQYQAHISNLFYLLAFFSFVFIFFIK